MQNVAEVPAVEEGHDLPVLLDDVEDGVLVAAELLERPLGEIRLEGPADLLGLAAVDLVDEPDHQAVDGVTILGPS